MFVALWEAELWLKNKTCRGVSSSAVFSAVKTKATTERTQQ